MRRRTLLLALCTVPVGFLAFEAATFPRVGHLARENPKTTAWMELRDREAAASGRKPRRYQA